MKQHLSRPRHSDLHLFQSEDRSMLLTVDQGLIYEIDQILAEVIDSAMEFGDEQRVNQILSASGINPDSSPIDAPPKSVPLRALSLAIAQKCNLGCTYCYAQQGTFGGNPKNMSLDIAKSSVDRLLQEALPGETVSLAFLGGEPLANRSALQDTTRYAADKARSAGVQIKFALTTNGTLLTPDDSDFFDRYGFTVTISLDGTKEKHDSLRPFKSGLGSYARVIEGSAVLLWKKNRRYRVLARVSVTPGNLNLVEALDELIQFGFDGVMFSPVLNSPSEQHQMEKAELEVLLLQMMECGKTFVKQLKNNQIYPFMNLIGTLRRIHTYKRDAYPCAAGGGYLGVSSEGGLYACHRFVDDEKGKMGNVAEGIDAIAQEQWLAARNVHTQEPCRTCWARHLCGGGCHHETIHRGRPACDYIRGWLHYCLEIYTTLLKTNPPLIHQILTPESLV